MIEYKLGWRKIVNKETQDAILEEVKRLAMPSAPRVYLAIRWLCIYVSIRPSELLRIPEKSVDLNAGLLVIEDHKTARKIKEPKVIPLLPYDIEFLKGLPRHFQEEFPLFRHDHAYNSNLKVGKPFGPKILYRFWKRACENLGIEGVDLYGGTRHSTMRFYRRHMSTEDVFRLSMHTTSKAGARYIEIDEDELRQGYALADGKGTPRVHRKAARKTAKPLNL